MADNLDDGEFWLPPHILADADVAAQQEEEDAALHSHPSLFPYNARAFHNGVFAAAYDFSSPSETESDEEYDSHSQQHFAELTHLTRRFADSSLLTDDLSYTTHKSKGVFGSGSPQSTLSDLGSEFGNQRGLSSNGSPNSVSQASSPKATWDLLRAAVGEVERMKMMMMKNEDYGYDFGYQRGILGVPSSNPVKKNPNTHVGFCNQPSLSHHQLQAARFQMLRQQQMEKVANGVGFNQQRQRKQAFAKGGVRSSEEAIGGGRNCGRHVGLSSNVWPSLLQAKQQQVGSGMRAVFLENPTVKRECAGTGVFLPRRVDNPTESRRKPACSTVLVPAKVMHALNLKFEDEIGGQPPYQPRLNGYDSHVPKGRYSNNVSQQSRYLRPQQRQVNSEIRLPPEWSY